MKPALTFLFLVALISTVEEASVAASTDEVVTESANNHHTQHSVKTAENALREVGKYHEQALHEAQKGNIVAAKAARSRGAKEMKAAFMLSKQAILVASKDEAQYEMESQQAMARGDTLAALSAQTMAGSEQAVVRKLQVETGLPMQEPFLATSIPQLNPVASKKAKKATTATKATKATHLEAPPAGKVDAIEQLKVGHLQEAPQMSPDGLKRLQKRPESKEPEAYRRASDLLSAYYNIDLSPKQMEQAAEAKFAVPTGLLQQTSEEGQEPTALDKGSAANPAAAAALARAAKYDDVSRQAMAREDIDAAEAAQLAASQALHLAMRLNAKGPLIPIVEKAKAAVAAAAKRRASAARRAKSSKPFLLEIGTPMTDAHAKRQWLMYRKAQKETRFAAMRLGEHRAAFKQKGGVQEAAPGAQHPSKDELDLQKARQREARYERQSQEAMDHGDAFAAVSAQTLAGNEQVVIHKLEAAIGQPMHPPSSEVEVRRPVQRANLEAVPVVQHLTKAELKDSSSSPFATWRRNVDPKEFQSYKAWYSKHHQAVNAAVQSKRPRANTGATWVKELKSKKYISKKGGYKKFFSQHQQEVKQLMALHNKHDATARASSAESMENDLVTTQRVQEYLEAEAAGARAYTRTHTSAKKLAARAQQMQNTVVPGVSSPPPSASLAHKVKPDLPALSETASTQQMEAKLEADYRTDAKVVKMTTTTMEEAKAALNSLDTQINAAKVVPQPLLAAYRVLKTQFKLAKKAVMKAKRAARKSRAEELQLDGPDHPQDLVLSAQQSMTGSDEKWYRNKIEALQHDTAMKLAQTHEYEHRTAASRLQAKRNLLLTAKTMKEAKSKKAMKAYAQKQEQAREQKKRQQQIDAASTQAEVDAANFASIKAKYLQAEERAAEVASNLAPVENLEAFTRETIKARVGKLLHAKESAPMPLPSTETRLALTPSAPQQKVDPQAASLVSLQLQQQLKQQMQAADKQEESTSMLLARKAANEAQAKVALLKSQRDLERLEEGP